MKHPQIDPAGPNRRRGFHILLGTVTALLVVATITRVVIVIRHADPRLEAKQIRARRDLRELRRATVRFYGHHHRLPTTLAELLPESSPQLARDPWHRPYRLETFAWHERGSGIDLVCTGPDRRPGGKGNDADIIARIDLDEIRLALKRGAVGAGSVEHGAVERERSPEGSDAGRADGLHAGPRPGPGTPRGARRPGPR